MGGLGPAIKQELSVILCSANFYQDNIAIDKFALRKN